jgi:predicted patatin/cPLA2 family phospholipase
VALAVEGGGMRGAVSAGMTVAIERLGMADCFDLVVGTSAGALNSAALLGGVAAGCAASYHGEFATRRFINPYRLLIGRAAIDVAFVLDHNSEALPRRRHDRTVANESRLRCVATDVATCEKLVLSHLRSVDELKRALLASSRLPWVGGDPVEFRGWDCLDGGLVESIPVPTALELGATHVLVLQTRPWGVERTPPAWLADRVIRSRLRKLNPRLVDLYERRSPDYEAAVADVARRTREPSGGGPFVCGIRLPEGSPSVGQLERNAGLIEAAVRAGDRHAETLLS